jgi:endonuclease YncB( thermonuclease family)
VSVGARLALALVGLAVGTIGVILILDSDGNLIRDRDDESLAKSSSVKVRVIEVVDGDTLVIGSGAHVRLIGIDTPEREQCGYREASDALRTLVEGRGITLVNPGSVQDEDSYGRLLRYVDRSGQDAAYDLLRAGLAVARYDSRDGYDPHPREKRYRAADRRVDSPCS